LEALETRRDELRDVINALNEENAALQAENKSLYAEMQAIKTRIATVQAAEAVCPLCGQPLGEEHKATLLEELQAEGTLRGDSYRANESHRKEIGDTIKAHRAEIGEIETELERLQALRERAGKLKRASRRRSRRRTGYRPKALNCG
jgi:DNA repair exonuclease SbcCD ATPase subunit